jgi:alpha-L-rhamnosidase
VGLIASETGGDADGLNRFALTVPANTVAQVELPGTGWNGVPDDTHADDGLTRFEAGPGTHEFTR